MGMHLLSNHLFSYIPPYSVMWLFEFIKNHWFKFFLILQIQRTISFNSLEKSKTHWFWLFQKPEPAVFMKGGA
jgi:hypothetical protein